MAEQDKETKQILNEGDRIARFAQSDDWRLIKAKLNDKCRDIELVTTLVLEGVKPEELLREVSIRYAVVNLVKQWIADIEGLSNQAQHTAGVMATDKKSDIIIRTDEQPPQQ